MIRLRVLFLASVCLAAMGCNDLCSSANKLVIAPSNDLLQYLDSNPDFTSLNSAGCKKILGSTDKFDAYAEQVRQRSYDKGYCSLVCLASHQEECRPAGTPDCDITGYVTVCSKAADVVHNQGAYNLLESLQVALKTTRSMVYQLCVDASKNDVFNVEKDIDSLRNSVVPELLKSVNDRETKKAGCGA